VANEQAKINRVGKELASGGWEHFVTDLNTQYYLKPFEVESMGNGIYRIPTLEFFTNSDDLYETIVEINCSAKTYRHISNLKRDISGKPVESIPVDSYVLNDREHVQKGSAMHALFMKICAKP
jgi:hypothetical protein